MLESFQLLTHGLSPTGMGLLAVNSGLRNPGLLPSLGRLGRNAWTEAAPGEQVQEMGSNTLGGGLSPW